MKCEQIEKLILLSDIHEPTSAEWQEIEAHLKKCRQCLDLAESSKEFKTFIEQLKKVESEIQYSAELTAKILEQVGKEKQAGKFRIAPYLRVAASVLLMAILGLYGVQRITVKNSVASLERKYKAKMKSNPLAESYAECRNQSEYQIKMFLKSNEDFTETLAVYALQIPQNKIEKYAAVLCMQTADEFLSADRAEKEQIILRFMKENFN